MVDERCYPVTVRCSLMLGKIYQDILMQNSTLKLGLHLFSEKGKSFRIQSTYILKCKMAQLLAVLP